MSFPYYSEDEMNGRSMFAEREKRRDAAEVPDIFDGFDFDFEPDRRETF